MASARALSAAAQQIGAIAHKHDLGIYLCLSDRDTVRTAHRMPSWSMVQRPEHRARTDRRQRCTHPNAEGYRFCFADPNQSQESLFTDMDDTMASLRALISQLRQQADKFAKILDGFEMFSGKPDHRHAPEPDAWAPSLKRGRPRKSQLLH